MRLENQNYKVVAENLELKSLIKAVKDISEEEWNKDKFRQNRFEVAKEVTTIMMKMNGSDTDAGDNPDKTVIFEDWYKWKDLVQPVLDQVIPLYKNAFVNKCMLPRLRAGAVIPKHYDSADTFAFSHRLHIPLVTNKEAKMSIGEEGIGCGESVWNMEVGKCYEINNRKLHGVENKGNDDRIHLLFDIYEQDE